MPPVTTDGLGGPCGAILGKYKHPNPSTLMSNSTNDGVMLAPCSLTSRGVVMETRHLTRARDTEPPLLVVRRRVVSDSWGRSRLCDAMLMMDPLEVEPGSGLSTANVAPELLASNCRFRSCHSSSSAAHDSGFPKRRKSRKSRGASDCVARRSKTYCSGECSGCFSFVRAAPHKVNNSPGRPASHAICWLRSLRSSDLSTSQA